MLQVILTNIYVFKHKCSLRCVRFHRGYQLVPTFRRRFRFLASDYYGFYYTSHLCSFLIPPTDVSAEITSISNCRARMDPFPHAGIRSVPFTSPVFPQARFSLQVSVLCGSRFLLAYLPLLFSGRLRHQQTVLN